MDEKTLARAYRPRLENERLEASARVLDTLIQLAAVRVPEARTLGAELFGLLVGAVRDDGMDPGDAASALQRVGAWERARTLLRALVWEGPELAPWQQPQIAPQAAQSIFCAMPAAECPRSEPGDTFDEREARDEDGPHCDPPLCAHPGAHGACVASFVPGPKLGRCIWCERDMHPAWRA